MTGILSFQSTTFDIVDRNGQPWLQARQIGQALGYSRPDAVLNLYERNKDEFSLDMVSSIELMEGGTLQNIRIFSLRGCHLLAMFARTPVAKSFRKWVLDVLETLYADKPALPSTTTPSTADDRAPLRALVHAWSQASGVTHQALWPQVKAHFQLSRIDDLPVEWLPDALAFVQGKIDALQRALPVNVAPAPVPALTGDLQSDCLLASELLRRGIKHIDSAYETVRDHRRATQGINPGGLVHEAMKTMELAEHALRITVGLLGRQHVHEETCRE